MSSVKSLVGQRYGALVVVERAKNTKSGATMWLCKCDCGNEKVVNGYSLRSGRSRSCGCEKSRAISEKKRVHGMSKTRLYNIWCCIIKRCTCPNERNYPNYGGRGIKVCEEWRNSFESFCEWSLSNGYADGLSIDRKNVYGDYEPCNCRWANAYEQGANKRNNVVIECNGERHILAEWARITGIDRRKISARIFKYGWSAEKALEIAETKI